MADIHRISGVENCRPGPRLAMRNSRTHRWESYELVEAVRDYLQSLNRANLSKELQAALDVSESYAEKLIGGKLTSISGHLLLSLDAWSGGELLRVLRNLPEPDERTARIRELAREIVELGEQE